MGKLSEAVCLWKPAWLAAAVLGLLIVPLSGCRSLPPGEEAAGRELSEEEMARFANAERQLHSADAKVRRDAAVALLSMEVPRAVRTVLGAIEGPGEADVRISVIEAARFSRDKRCFPALLAAVQDPSAEVRAAAAGALARFTRPAEVEAMSQLLQGEDATAQLRELLFRAFGEGLVWQAVPLLLEGLSSEQEEVRQAAWQALKAMSDRDFPLEPGRWQQWWEANRYKSREQVLEEKLRSRRAELQAANAALEDVRLEFEEMLVLVKHGEAKRLEVLLKALGSQHVRVRELAAFQLSQLPPDEVGSMSLSDEETYWALSGALEDESVEVRVGVVKLVVRADGSYRGDLLRKALEDTSAAVLVPAVDAVEMSMNGLVRRRLEELLAGSGSSAVREAAAKALGKLGDSQAIQSLIEALDDEEENVRWFAVESLRKLQAVEAVPRLSDLLAEDSSARVREITASTLGQLGQPTAVLALKAALGDQNDRVRQKVVSALQSLAVGSYDRMVVVADSLLKYGYREAAKDMLRKVVETFEAQENSENKVIEAKTRLAAILKGENDFAGAAVLYVELDELTAGVAKIREELLDCWLRDGKAAELAPKIAEWLGAAEGEELNEVINLGAAAVLRLAQQQEKAQADEILDLLTAAAAEAEQTELVEKLEKLKERIQQ